MVGEMMMIFEKTTFAANGCASRLPPPPTFNPILDVVSYYFSQIFWRMTSLSFIMSLIINYNYQSWWFRKN